MTVQSHLLVDDVMRRWPGTIRVFLDFKLGCVGCPIAGFHDIDDACREHHIDRDAFLVALTATLSEAAHDVHTRQASCLTVKQP